MKIALLDRDGTLNFASADKGSPFYRITKPEHLILKPGVREAVALLRAHGWQVALITKQRETDLNEIHAVNLKLQDELGFIFAFIMVEGFLPNKRKHLEKVVANYPKCPKVLFDDSPEERSIAVSLGIEAYDGLNLLESVESFLHVR